VRILWLFGPPGAGKSVTTWELLNLLADGGEPTSYVDIDQLGMAAPQPRDDSEAHRYKTWALAAVSREHARRGATTLVVSGSGAGCAGRVQRGRRLHNAKQRE